MGTPEKMWSIFIYQQTLLETLLLVIIMEGVSTRNPLTWSIDEVTFWLESFKKHVRRDFDILAITTCGDVFALRTKEDLLADAGPVGRDIYNAFHSLLGIIIFFKKKICTMFVVISC